MLGSDSSLKSSSLSFKCRLDRAQRANLPCHPTPDPSLFLSAQLHRPSHTCCLSDQKKLCLRTLDGSWFTSSPLGRTGRWLHTDLVYIHLSLGICVLFLQGTGKQVTRMPCCLGEDTSRQSHDMTPDRLNFQAGLPMVSEWGSRSGTECLGGSYLSGKIISNTP